MRTDGNMRLLTHCHLWFALFYQRADLFRFLAHPNCDADKRCLQAHYIVPLVRLLPVPKME